MPGYKSFCKDDTLFKMVYLALYDATQSQLQRLKNKDILPPGLTLNIVIPV